jgi:sulfate permease
MNIGGSGTAASMGAAYGGGAIKNRMTAVTLVAVFAFAGALTGGGHVVETIGENLIPSELITLEVAVIIITSACFTLFISNRMGIPLSTSEVTVGSVVGVGLVFHAVQWQQLLIIVVAWMVLPVIAFFSAYMLGRVIRPIDRYVSGTPSRLVIRLLTALLILFGCYEAFSAGMNNVANAIGPLVGGNVISSESGLLMGAVFMALGAFWLGGRVLETNGKKITKMSLAQGSVVSFTGGTLVLIASFMGLPVPLTQATTMAILGVGAEKTGFGLLHSPVVKKIAKVWVISPLASLFFSYSLIQVILFHSHVYASLLSGALVAMLVFMYSSSKLFVRIK